MSPETEERRGETRAEEAGRLPFDRGAWAQTTEEARDSLRRQYGREARSHADG